MSIQYIGLFFKVGRQVPNQTLILIVIAVLLALIPWPPLSLIGGVALMIVLPGRELARWLGLERGWPGLVLSLALGLLIVPLILFWGGWLVGFSRLETVGICLLFTLGLAWLNRRYGPESDRSPAMRLDRWLIAILAILALSIGLAYLQPETAAGSYPVQMGDWVKHYGVAWAVRHTGIPPTNLFFGGMAPAEKIHYYYLFHLAVASLDIIRGGPSNIHTSFVAMALVASLSFAGMFYRLARRLLGDIWSARAALLFVSLIGGLDIVPMLYQSGGLALPHDHIDNWIPTQYLRISTFMVHHLWVPQHLTALLAVTVGMYLYSTQSYGDSSAAVGDDRAAGWRWLPVLALLIAALPGYSAWIGLVVFAALLLFGLHQVGRLWLDGDRSDAIRRLGGYGLLALGGLILALPVILALRGNRSAQAGITFEIPRQFGDWPWLSSIWWVDLPLHYLIEMGGLLVGGLLGWRLFYAQNRRQEPLLPFLSLLLVIGLGLVSFFASGRGYAGLGLILNNDLGLRAIMPAQLVLALFAGYHLVRAKKWQVAILIPLLGLGLASSLWEVGAMGLAKYSRPPEVPADVLAVYDQMPALTPPLAVVQHRSHDTFSRVQPTYTGRFNGYSTSEAIIFHNDPLELALAIELAEQAFANTIPLRSYQLLRSLGADYVFVGPAEQSGPYDPAKFQQPFYFTPRYRAGNVSLIQIRPLFSDTVQAAFDGGVIQFRGAFVDPRPVYPGEPPPEQPPAFVTAWQLTRPVEKNYTLFIHLADEEGQIVAQADHQLWAWDVSAEGPTTIWRPGLTHLDMTPIPAGAVAAAGPLTIRLGLWLPETGRSFPPEAAILPVDETGRLIVGDTKQWLISD